MQSSPSKRVVGKPFQKGRSGNPGGRPKDAHRLTELARKECPQALATLAALMADEKVEPSTRIRAAEAILNRGMGRVLAMEPVGTEEPSLSEPEPMTEEEIRWLQRIATGGKPKESQPPQMARESAGASLPTTPARCSTTPTPPPSATPSPPPPSGAPSKDDPLQGCTPDQRRTAVLAAIGILPK